MRRLLLLALLLPWGAPLLVALLHVAPEGPGIVDLSGTWEWSPVDDPTQADTQWHELTLPGRFRRQGVTQAEFWLRRRFEWHAQVEAALHLLTVGDLKQAQMRVYLNGALVGDVSAFDERQKAEWQSLEVVQVPTARLREGPNELLLRVASNGAITGIADSRLLLGPSSKLGAWSIRVTRLESFFRHAPLLVYLLLLPLLVVLLRLETARRERRLIAAALGIAISSGLYLVTQTGLGLVGVVPNFVRNLTISPSVFASGWLFCEFCSAYFFERAPWYVRALRVVVPLGALGSTVEIWLNPASIRVYSAVVPAVMLSALVLTAQMASHLRSRRDWGALFVFSTALSYVACALGDTLTDLHLWVFPRTFATAQLNIPVLTGIVVIARFIRLAERNKQLSVSLSESNKDLARALVDAKAATRVKSEFLANVSHELRTPLNSIINIPEGLLEDFQPTPEGGLQWVGDTAHTYKYLRTLHTAGTHLLGVVNQVLDFSKLEAGKMVLHPEQISIESLTEDMVQTLEAFGKKRGIALVASGNREGRFEADRVAASQVLLNLCNNAIKFSSDHATVELVVVQTPECVEFRVVDHGIGISKENQALIFESFRQVEAGATRRFGGTGLGLPISRQILQLHGGELLVESEPGKGSTFTARFPRSARLAPVEVTPPKPAHRVVIVDDDPINIETFRLTLRPLDAVEVLAVEDPRQALAFIESSRPDLIVLDIMMPHVSGLTLLKQLRAHPVLQRTPVLVVSAYTSNREVIEPLGATWVSKPWDDKVLQDVVRGALSPRADIDPGASGEAARQ